MHLKWYRLSICLVLGSSFIHHKTVWTCRKLTVLFHQAVLHFKQSVHFSPKCWAAGWRWGSTIITTCIETCDLNITSEYNNYVSLNKKGLPVPPTCIKFLRKLSGWGEPNLENSVLTNKLFQVPPAASQDDYTLWHPNTDRAIRKPTCYL